MTLRIAQRAHAASHQQPTATIPQDSSAHAAGLAIVPVTIGASAFAGWYTCPAIAPPPEQLLDFAGWSKCVGSLPIKRCGAVGLASAGAAAVACRVIQYRGGA